MKNLTKKIVAIILITLLSILMISTKAFAKNENIQIVKADNNYIIYVKDMTDAFKYATSETGDLDADSIELKYINSVKDGGDNQVAVLKDETAKFLYIKQGEKNVTVELDFTQATERDSIAEVEELTDTIKTDIIVINQRDEQVEQVKYEETVGGLEIKDDKNASYEYISKKLPAEKYSEIQEFISKLNSEYKDKDMYSKIEFLKEFRELYDEVINEVTTNKEWQPVEDMKITQPEDAQKDDKFVVLLKKVAGDTTTYDVKILTSDRTETAPEKVEEQVVIRKTIKLPNTGDSLILFAILAVVIVALIIVFIRIRKIKNKGND